MVNRPINGYGGMSLFHSDSGQVFENSVRRQNRRLVLEEILAQKAISRVELCRVTGLSASTVGSIVNDLVKRGFLIESGTGESSRGRKPIVIELQPLAATVIGVDLNELVGNVFDLNSEPIYKFIKIPRKENGGITPEDVVKLIENIYSEVPSDIPPPQGIGISAPATIDLKTGSVVTSSNLGWENVSLAQKINGVTGIPVALESSMICLALSEAWNGIAEGEQNFVYVHVGKRGIGAGIVINGDVIRGAFCKAGEIGHIQIDKNGEKCYCGNSGCLELIASGMAITKKAHQKLIDNGQSELAQTIGSFDDVVDAIRFGDEICKDILHEAGKALGEGLSHLITLIDPKLVVIGGACMSASDLLIPIIQKEVREKALALKDKSVRIVPVKDSDERSAEGAASVAVRRLLLDVSSQGISTGI